MIFIAETALHAVLRRVYSTPFHPVSATQVLKCVQCVMKVLWCTVVEIITNIYIYLYLILLTRLILKGIANFGVFLNNYFKTYIMVVVRSLLKFSFPSSMTMAVL